MLFWLKLRLVLPTGAALAVTPARWMLLGKFVYSLVGCAPPPSSFAHTSLSKVPSHRLCSFCLGWSCAVQTSMGSLTFPAWLRVSFLACFQAGSEIQAPAWGYFPSRIILGFPSAAPPMPPMLCQMALDHMKSLGSGLSPSLSPDPGFFCIRLGEVLCSVCLKDWPFGKQLVVDPPTL